jgi:hypothetical protein
VVNTGSEGLFDGSIDTTQNFVIAIQDKQMSTRQLLGGFAQFNRDEFRTWNLASQLKETENYRLLVIKGIPTLNESMSYFRKAMTTRNLFDPLGQATYKSFLITDENLQRLIDQNKVEEYINFFRSYYIERKQAPSNISNTTTQTTAVTQSVPKQPEKYSGPYTEEIEDEHYFVFVIPTLDIDQPAFVSGIEEFNTANFANLSLKLEVIPLDDIRQIVRISGLTNKETATPYFNKIKINRTLYEPLRDGQYRNFLITKENFEIFLREKNIIDYMDFYKRFYLENN